MPAIHDVDEGRPLQHTRRRFKVINILARFALAAVLFGSLAKQLLPFHPDAHVSSDQPKMKQMPSPTPLLTLSTLLTNTTMSPTPLPTAADVLGPPCAINLYGLPRQFKALVLPSFVKHIIQVNVKYQCDYFVQYYELREEVYVRGADEGRSGKIDPEEIKLLTEQVLKAHAAFVPTDGSTKRRVPPLVEYVKTTDESFYQKYQPLLHRIHTERGGPDNKLLFIPVGVGEAFPNATLANIIKMWHSMETVWNLMETHRSNKSSTSGLRRDNASSPNDREQQTGEPYGRVAMFRSDVLYTGPIDIYELPDNSTDQDNRFAVIPDFANHPVNDRMFIGPAAAVKIYAAGRFERLEEHVHRVLPTGIGIHPEKFLHHTIFPAIRNETGVAILPMPSQRLCFLRVRSDASVRFTDCGVGCASDENRKVVEHIVQRSCRLTPSNPQSGFLEYGDAVQDASNRTHNEATTWEACVWDG